MLKLQSNVRRLMIAGASLAALAACSPQASETAETAETAAPAETAEAVKAEEPVEITVPSGVYVAEKNHAYITASYNHLGFSRPTLTFTGFDATLNFDAEDPSKSTVEATVSLTTLDTGVEVFEEHIRGENFFDAASFPEATFKSTSVEVTGAKTGTMTGDLTIKGVTKPVTFDIELRGAGDSPMTQKPHLGFAAHTTILRSDFNAGAYAPAVSDEVEINIEIEFDPAE